MYILDHLYFISLSVCCCILHVLGMHSQLQLVVLLCVSNCKKVATTCNRLIVVTDCRVPTNRTSVVITDCGSRYPLGRLPCCLLGL